MSKIYFAYYLGLLFGALLALSIRKLINWTKKLLIFKKLFVYLLQQDKRRVGLKIDEHLNVCGCFHKAQDAERTASDKY